MQEQDDKDRGDKKKIEDAKKEKKRMIRRMIRRKGQNDKTVGMNTYQLPSKAAH